MGKAGGAVKTSRMGKRAGKKLRGGVEEKAPLNPIVEDAGEEEESREDAGEAGVGETDGPQAGELPREPPCERADADLDAQEVHEVGVAERLRV